MIYISPQPLLTSLALCWFAFFHMLIWKYFFSVFITSKSLCTLFPRPHIQYPSLMPAKVHLPYIISCHWCRNLKSGKVCKLLHSISSKKCFCNQKTNSEQTCLHQEFWDFQVLRTYHYKNIIGVFPVFFSKKRLDRSVCQAPSPTKYNPPCNEQERQEFYNYFWKNSVYLVRLSP